MNDSGKYYAFKPDTIAKKIVMFDYKDSTIKSTFNYSFPQKNILLLTGTLNKHAVTIEMKQYDMNKFLLMNRRGFHWVNEYPMNR